MKSDFHPTFQKTKCERCGNCVKICPVHAISQDEDRFLIIDLETCIGCGVYVSNFSKGALQLIKINNQRPAIEAYVNFADQKVGG